MSDIRHVALAPILALFIFAPFGCGPSSALTNPNGRYVSDIVLSDVCEPDVIHWGQADNGLQVGLVIRRVPTPPYYDLTCRLKNTGDRPTWVLNPSQYYGEDGEAGSCLEYNVNGRCYHPPCGGFFLGFPSPPTAESFKRLEPGQTIEGRVLHGVEEWRDEADVRAPPAPAPPWQVDVTYVYRNRWPELVAPVRQYGLWYRRTGGASDLNLFAHLSPVWTGEARSGVVRVRLNQLANQK